MSFSRKQGIRHNRIIDLRLKMERKWTPKELMNFCLVNLDVSKATATSYIDEAAEPYRKKYQKENISE